jgi:anti-anti-sigma factor
VAGGEEANVLRDAVKVLVEEKAANVLFDLSGVPWMNSGGVGVLVQSYTSLHNAGARVKFLSVSERVRSILHITRLLGVLEIYASREEALRGFRAT